MSLENPRLNAVQIAQRQTCLTNFRTIYILRQQRTGWVGPENGKFLLTFSTGFADVDWWVRKGPKCDNVICGFKSFLLNKWCLNLEDK